jgi:hypothetical protein
MLELLFTGALLVIQLLALSCLALAQAPHWRTLFGPRRWSWQSHLRPLGWTGLLLALGLAWRYQGGAFGSLIWVLSLPLSGYIVVFVLAGRSGS